MVIDRNYQIVLANRTVRQFTGGIDPVVNELKCHQVSHRRETPCEGQHDPCPLNWSSRAGGPKKVIHRHFDFRGEESTVEVTATPLIDDNNEIRHVIESCYDITELKRVETELHCKAGCRGRQPGQERIPGEYEPRDSHPDDGNLGIHRYIAENPTHDESAEAIQVIQRNGHNLLQLINDILDLSKIEAGKQQMDLQTCSPRNIVSEVVSTMQVRADAKRLRLRAAFDANVPDLIQTDPTRLRQILVNLVGNAIKFTEVGEVQMVVRLATASAGGAKLSFDVIDTGIGMSEEQVRMLFRPFSQVDGSATRRFGGTGLGLAVSKRLAEMLGGDIRVHSSPGQGSIFSLSIGTGNTVGLTMPRVSDKPSTTSGTEGIGWKKLDYHILLAEDGPDNQRLIAFLLRKAGAEVNWPKMGRLRLILSWLHSRPETLSI